MAESWARIGAWLQKHAPATFAQLAPPADPAEIARVQDEMGLKFPQDLVDSLLCHNGLTRYSRANFLPALYPPLSAEEILAHWQSNVEINEDLNLDGEQEPDDQWFHPLWIPFGEAEGDSQVIDMRDGSGQVGMHLHDMGGVFNGAWPSLAEYLSATAEALVEGVDAGGRFPYLDEKGELSWDLAGRLHERAPAGL
ncbi:hypothetical protein FKR81_04580 [Lentzea tibetensis]|uniref:Knr4/Smi1-like domain-containing protein n=1 Tax=Lentzea tibetensis TaxID=2591470 RepID=A0A563F0S8_9PSEU|nr:hypothetical protein FKR81_04580 [Lentzea tibetensis]